METYKYTIKLNDGRGEKTYFTNYYLLFKEVMNDYPEEDYKMERNGNEFTITTNHTEIAHDLLRMCRIDIPASKLAAYIEYEQTH